MNEWSRSIGLEMSEYVRWLLLFLLVSSSRPSFTYEKIVTIVAFDRLYYFRQALEALAAADGAEDYTVLISIDGFPKNDSFEGFKYSPSRHKHESVIALAHKYQQTVQLSQFPFKAVNIRIASINLGYPENKRQALEWAFDYTDYAIFLEDDIVLSSDGLRWFESHVYARTIFTSPHLAFITCYGYAFPLFQGEKSSSIHILDTALVHELGLLDVYHPHGWHTPWGWSTWRSTWDTLQLKNWSGNAIDLGNILVTKGLHEFTPVVSRCDNIGAHGVNMGQNSHSPVHGKLTFSSHFSTQRLRQCKYQLKHGPFVPIRVGLDEVNYPPNSTIASLLALASKENRDAKRTASC
jgi:hypothetical protein